MGAGQTEVRSPYGFHKYTQGSKFQGRYVTPVDLNTPLGVASYSSKRNATLEADIGGILYNVFAVVGGTFLLAGILSWLPK